VRLVVHATLDAGAIFAADRVEHPVELPTTKRSERLLEFSPGSGDRGLIVFGAHEHHRNFTAFDQRLPLLFAHPGSSAKSRAKSVAHSPLRSGWTFTQTSPRDLAQLEGAGATRNPQMPMPTARVAARVRAHLPGQDHGADTGKAPAPTSG